VKRLEQQYYAIIIIAVCVRQEISIFFSDNPYRWGGLLPTRKCSNTRPPEAVSLSVRVLCILLRCLVSHQCLYLPEIIHGLHSHIRRSLYLLHFPSAFNGDICIRNAIRTSLYRDSLSFTFLRRHYILHFVIPYHWLHVTCRDRYIAIYRKRYRRHARESSRTLYITVYS